MSGDPPKIYVAGHRGLVGSAIVRRLESAGLAKSLVVRTKAELDLTDARAVRGFFAEERPTHVYLAAAKVGGILANDSFPVDFLRDNLLIQTSVFDAAYQNGTRKLVFLGSSCIYPRLAPQPMKEEHLLTGPLEPTNSAYAIAKIAGIELAKSYRKQYGFSAISLMPTNLYGPGDNFDLQGSHVLPALLRKMVEAKASGAAEVVVWGSGTPRRELLFADDLADAAVFLMEHYDDAAPINVGVGDDVSIAELAGIIREAVGFSGELRFDRSKPDGTPRKLLDVSKLTALGWRAKTALREGIERTLRWYLDAGPAKSTPR
ncbi:GDP-L-fucose synthase [soil metagenome]